MAPARTDKPAQPTPNLRARSNFSKAGIPIDTVPDGWTARGWLAHCSRMAGYPHAGPEWRQRVKAITQRQEGEL